MLASLPVIGVATIYLLRKLLAVHDTPERFAHWVRCLATVNKDGGTLTISSDTQPAMLRFERAEGEGEPDESCTLFLDVPRTTWAEQHVGAIAEFLEGRGIDWCEPPERPNVILRTRLVVPDIWDDGAGAAGARLAQQIFETVGVARNTRFKISTRGENSNRLFARKAPEWKYNRSAVLRFYAKQAVKGFDAASDPDERGRSRLIATFAGGRAPGGLHRVDARFCMRSSWLLVFVGDSRWFRGPAASTGRSGIFARKFVSHLLLGKARP